jgi:hypothetical protein
MKPDSDLKRTLRAFARRHPDDADDEELEDPKTCGYCGWSWCAGNQGTLLCINPDSPHCYDAVPVDMKCGEQDPDSSRLG